MCTNFSRARPSFPVKNINRQVELCSFWAFWCLLNWVPIFKQRNCFSPRDMLLRKFCFIGENVLRIHLSLLHLGTTHGRCTAAKRAHSLLPYSIEAAVAGSASSSFVSTHSLSDTAVWVSGANYISIEFFKFRLKFWTTLDKLELLSTHTNYLAGWCCHGPGQKLDHDTQYNLSKASSIWFAVVWISD